jgi:N utilization substance protein B
MPNWRLDRLSAIDRNILRIGTVEMLRVRDVPPRVAIHEAIRLAERYGSEDSPGFVNGVLDAVSRRISGS